VNCTKLNNEAKLILNQIYTQKIGTKSNITSHKNMNFNLIISDKLFYKNKKEGKKTRREKKINIHIEIETQSNNTK
jgi:hypothetical protein